MVTWSSDLVLMLFKGIWAVWTATEFVVVWILPSPGPCVSSISGSVYQILGCEAIFRTDWFASIQFTDNINQLSYINSQTDSVFLRVLSLHCSLAWVFLLMFWDYLPLHWRLSADFSVVGFWFFKTSMFYKSWKHFPLAALFLAPPQQCIKIW